MPSVRTMWIATIYPLALFLAGCGGGAAVGDGGSSPSGQPQLTVAGRPSVRVTDTVGVSLTKEQRDNIIKKCKQHAGVPGTNEDCQTLIATIAIVVDNSPCTSVNPCLLIGILVDNPNIAVMKVVEQGHDGSTCADQQIDACVGITVQRDVAAPLLEKSRTSTSTSGTPSPTSSDTTPSDSETPEPSVSGGSSSPTTTTSLRHG